MTRAFWIVVLVVGGLILAVNLPRGNRATHGVKVSATTFLDQYGAAWPLTVSGGTLDCQRGIAVTLEADGHTYAINGGARALMNSSKPDWRPLDLIWAAAPPKYIGNVNVAAPKVDIGPLIRAGLALCD